MLCPACRKEMLTLEFRSIELDCCAECGGVWLDSGEIAVVAEGAGALKPDLLSALQAAEGVKRHEGRKRLCPVCGKRMESVGVPGEEDVVVERCPRKHGLWFDRGELQAVVKAAGAEPENDLARLLADLAKGEKSRA